MRKGTKVWLIIFIIDIILIAAGAVAGAIFILPKYYEAKFYNAIEAGKREEASKILFTDFGFVKKRVDVSLPDYLTYYANLYLDGKTDYDTVKDIYIEIENMDGYATVTEPYFSRINSIEIINAYKTAVRDYIDNGSKGYVNPELKEAFDTVYLIKKYFVRYADNFKGDYKDTLDSVLNSELEEQFATFQSGEMKYRVIDAYAEIAVEYYYDKEYATWVKNSLRGAADINDAYLQAREHYRNKEYFECIELLRNSINEYKGNELYATFKDDYESLLGKAETEGKEYYISEAVRLAKEESFDEAIELADKTKEFFKDADISEVQELCRPKWKEKYKEYLHNLPENIKEDMGKGVSVAGLFNSSEYSTEGTLPEKLYIADIDGDDVPDMILMDDEKAFFYGCDRRGVYFLGVCNLLGLASDGVVSHFGGSGHDAYYYLGLSNGKWDIKLSAVKDDTDNGTVYKVDNAESDADGYEAAVQEIQSKIKEVKSVSVEDYESYIDSLKD